VQLLSEDLERIDNGAFIDCPSLRRIFIPLKDNLLDDEDVEDHGGFYKCDALSQVHLIGGIHKTVSSLLLDSWKNEMKDEIDIINQVLPYYDDDKTPAIRQWIRSVLQRIEHFKREHYALLKERCLNWLFGSPAFQIMLTPLTDSRHVLPVAQTS
jgi:hypothetical protein